MYKCVHVLLQIIIFPYIKEKKKIETDQTIPTAFEEKKVFHYEKE